MSVEHIRPKEIVENQESPDILLINVPSTFNQGHIPDDEEPPFGLIRIAQACERGKFRPSILDAHRAKNSLNDIDDVLYGLKPRLVGLNPTSVNVPEAQEIAEICAKRGIPIIIGGVHATIDTINCLTRDFPMAYAVVKGKGEYPTLHILRNLRNRQSKEINGVYYQGSDPRRTDYADHYPLNELLPIDLPRWVKNPLITHVVNLKGIPVELREAPLYVTSGCPFQCTYCASPVLNGRGMGYVPYHRPDMKKIIESVELTITALRANAVHFLDDLAFAIPAHFNEFISGIAKLSLNEPFYWRAMTRASVIGKCSDHDLEIIAQSGCWRIAIGVESGDEDMLKRIKKGITLNQVKEAVYRLRRAGIPQVKGFFIMGFPDETLEQILATKRFIMELKKWGLTDISLFQFKPYPGTEEWRYLEQTNPDLLNNISYLRNYNSKNRGIVDKKIVVDAILPDDSMIAKVPSKIIRQIILETLEEFYGN